MNDPFVLALQKERRERIEAWSTAPKLGSDTRGWSGQAERRPANRKSPPIVMRVFRRREDLQLSEVPMRTDGLPEESRYREIYPGEGTYESYDGVSYGPNRVWRSQAWQRSPEGNSAIRAWVKAWRADPDLSYGEFLHGQEGDE